MFTIPFPISPTAWPFLEPVVASATIVIPNVVSAAPFSLGRTVISKQRRAAFRFVGVTIESEGAPYDPVDASLGFTVLVNQLPVTGWDGWISPRGSVAQPSETIFFAPPGAIVEIVAKRLNTSDASRTVSGFLSGVSWPITTKSVASDPTAGLIPVDLAKTLPS